MDMTDLAVADLPPPVPPTIVNAESGLLGPSPAVLSRDTSTSLGSDGTDKTGARRKGKRKTDVSLAPSASFTPEREEDKEKGRDDDYLIALADLALLKPKDYITCNSSHTNIGNNNNALIGLPLKEFLHFNDMYNRLLESEFVRPLRRLVPPRATNTTAPPPLPSEEAPADAAASSGEDFGETENEEGNASGDYPDDVEEAGESGGTTGGKQKMKRRFYSEAKLQALLAQQEALFCEHDTLAREAYRRTHTVPFRAVVRRESEATGEGYWEESSCGGAEASTTYAARHAPASAASPPAAAVAEEAEALAAVATETERPVPYYVASYLKELGAVEVMPPFLTVAALEEFNRQHRLQMCYPVSADSGGAAGAAEGGGGGGDCTESTHLADGNTKSNRNTTAVAAAATGAAMEGEDEEGAGLQGPYGALHTQARWRQVHQQLLAAKVKALVDAEVDTATQEVNLTCGSVGGTTS